MPAVSILVPCYNVENYVRQCLDSVTDQTLTDMEIICINDGSTDNTPAILREYAARDCRIRIIDKPNSGYGDSMNNGIDAATGEYIGIVESDDWADPDMFESLYLAAKEHDADLVKSNFYNYAGGVSTLNRIIPLSCAGKTLTPRRHAETFLQTTYVWTDLFRRSWLNRHGIRFLATPGASYQDMSFNFKTLACAERVFFLNRAFLHYRRDNEASSVNSQGKAFCVCDEYREIERFLARMGEEGKEILQAELLRKYQVYYWNFRRLSMPLSKKFCLRASCDFRRDFKLDRVNRSLFKPKHYRKLRRWAFRPALFFWTETLLCKNGRRKVVDWLKGKLHG